MGSCGKQRHAAQPLVSSCWIWIASFLVVTAQGTVASDCVAAVTPEKGNLNGFFNLSSHREFHWKLTTRRVAKSSGIPELSLELQGTRLRPSDYATLVSTPIRADSQHTTCSASFSYKVSGGHMSVKQLVGGKFMEMWCETVEHPAWRTVHFRLHYTGRLRVFFNVSPLKASTSLNASLANIAIQCCRDVSGCIYYPSPDFHCGMAGFKSLSKVRSSPEVSWERNHLQGLLQFSSPAGEHASMVSPLYWWHASRPAQCVVQFQSQPIQWPRKRSNLALPRNPGRLELSVYGLNEVLWYSRFSGVSFRSRHRQQFFSLATTGPFQLLINASAQHPNVAITVEGFSVHCCPANPLGDPNEPFSTVTADAFATEGPGGKRDGSPWDLITPTLDSPQQTTYMQDNIVSSTREDTSLKEKDQSKPDYDSRHIKAVMIPMGCVAFILVTVIAVFCCKKQQATPSSNGSSNSDAGLRRPFQASMNNPGYEETIPVLQRVSRQSSDALSGKTSSNDVLQPHSYENNTLQVRQTIEENPVGEQQQKRKPYENTSLANNNGKAQIHRSAGYENSNPVSQHSGETLPLGRGNGTAATAAGGGSGAGSSGALAGTPQSAGDHFYHRLDLTVENADYSQPFVQPPCTAGDLYSHLAEREYLRLDHDTIHLKERIGQGHFAHVYKGEWNVGDEVRHVAVKKLKSGASAETTTRFLRESAIMAQFNHQHIVRLYGVVVQGEPMMLVLELMTCNLQQHLQSLRESQYNKKLQGHLLSLCRQIAFGMEYLESRLFVHRDLAARNVMLDPNSVCKIGDFGMARDISADQIYVSGNERVFPIKWTAPEAIEFIQFTSASDCWSYGVTLYEIWSLGEKPYGAWANEEVFKQVKGGYRLPSPRKCPHTVYYLMLQCWQAEQKNRPSFKEVIQCLSDSDDSLLAF
eukprot:scpid20563/ scgid4905/ Ephrin type-B receptor 1